MEFTCNDMRMPVVDINSIHKPFPLRVLYPQQALFVEGILFSRYPSVCPSVTFCFLNILKSHRWNFIKPCKQIHIYKTKTFNKK